MVRSKRTDHLKLFAMNAGTKTTGRWLMGATYAKEDLTAREDKLDLTAVSSNTGESGSLPSVPNPCVIPRYRYLEEPLGLFVL